MSLADRMYNGSFENEEALNAWLNRSGYSLRKPGPVLRLRQPVPKPQMPEFYRGYQTGYNYPIEAPATDPHHVFVGNRDNFTGDWYRIGDPIDPSKVGNTTYNAIGHEETFQPSHHNFNIGHESHLSEEELRHNLEQLNLPTEGDRTSLFKRMINVKESPNLMDKLVQGEKPSELELADIVNRHEPINLQQAARLRSLRNPQSQPLNATQNRWQNSRLNPTNWLPQNNPRRVDGSELSNAEANSLRAWGSQNIANQRQNLSAINGLGTGSNPMTISQMPGSSSAEANLAKTATPETSMPMGTFSGRAMPMISLALLANSFLQNSQAKQEQEQFTQTQKMMRG